MAEKTSPNPSESGLASIEQESLTPIVRQALNSDSCNLIDWTYQTLHNGGDRGAGLSGVYRFAGNASESAETKPWSLILKVIGSEVHGGDLQGGKRERLAYQSGLLNSFSGNFKAARCFEISKRSEGVYWLWLEDLADQASSEWLLDHYALVARHLGQFNGNYLGKVSLTDWPWLSTEWLRKFIAPNAAAVTQLKDVLDHPLVSRWYPSDVAEGLSQLWEDRELLLSALERQPQTLCHRDAWSPNLFLCVGDKGVDETVAIDWAFVGLGALGEDVVPLAQTRNCFKPQEAAEVNKLVFTNYLEGLYDANWKGNPESVRFGFAASSALRYGLGLIAQHLERLLSFDDHKARFVKQVYAGRSIEEVADLWSIFLRSLIVMGEEARALLAKID